MNNVSSPDKWVVRAWANDLCLYRGHEDVAKSNCHFSAHSGTVCMEIVFSIKLEGVFF